MASQNSVANFKAAKYFQNPAYFHFMRDDLPALAKPDTLYDLRMWILLPTPDGVCRVIEKKNLSLTEYKQELDMFKQICEKFPKVARDFIIENYEEND